MILFQMVICPISMRPKLKDQYLKRIADAWLTASVHVDAFRIQPLAYLTATKWWFLRKRVRAWGQFAPLLSQSRKAYVLWVSRQERQRSAHSPPDDISSIIALIDMTGDHGSEDIAATLDAVTAEGLSVLVVGAVEAPTLAATIEKIEWEHSPWLLLLACGDRIADRKSVV